MLWSCERGELEVGVGIAEPAKPSSLFSEYDVLSVVSSVELSVEL